MKNKIHLKITSNNGVILDEYVNYINVPLTDGECGIQSDHQAMIGALKSGTVKYRIGNQLLQINIEPGVISVLKNEVEILVRGTAG